MRSSSALAIALLLGACASYQSPPPDDHVVPAPISERANIVLRSLIEDYASADGDWRGCRWDGCASIWGTQFGYRAAIAKAPRESEDIATAREAVDACGYRVNPKTGEMRAGFDDGGVARATVGSTPLLVDFVVTRLGEGAATTYRVDSVLRER